MTSLSGQEQEAIASAVAYLRSKTNKKPEAAAVVSALVAAEKSAKQAQSDYSLSDLTGTWQLGFITGTKKARKTAGAAFGIGRFLPKFLAVTIAYSQAEDDSDRGSVRNSVRVGPLEFALSGPISFHPKSNILAFDFIHMTVSMADVELYSGEVRGGSEQTASFYDVPLKEKAFFTYFAIADDYIAARGKGGGLALWTKTSPD